MPWHAKLGFQRGPYISVLHSLSPDGGCVAFVDIVVVKVRRHSIISEKAAMTTAGVSGCIL